MSALLTALLAVCSGPCDPTTSKSAEWQFAGPSTYVNRGDDLNISSAGAIQDVVSSAKTGSWFVGSVNGGVWKSTTLSKAVPSWENVLDGQPVTCSAIGALHVGSSGAVYAGCGGSTSSEQGVDWNVLNSGDWAGLMASHDDGKTWAMLPGFPPNFYVTSILETEQGDLVVSAQSHLWNATDGGIWHGSPSTAGVGARATGTAASGGSWDWSRVSTRPTFTLLQLPMNEGVPGGLLATHARLPQHTVSISLDHGSTWTDLGGFGDPMGWKNGAIPFYTCAAVVGESLVVAGLTNQHDNVSATDSAFFVRPLPIRAGDDWTPLAQPTAMDEDAMPKDRMAVLGDPEAPGLMYVAGNAGALAWRVNISSGVWTKMWDTPDVLDGSEAHGDCRNYAWDAAYPGGRLVLVSDGGIFARLGPRQPGGKWVSLNGDIKAMEYLSAHYDNRADRFVAGAQDNAAQVFAPHAGPDAVAVGFVDGDGTVTLVDNVHNPSRLYGTAASTLF